MSANKVYNLYMMYKLEQNEWLTVTEIADYLKLSPEMVYKLVQNRELPAIKIGSSWRIRRDDLENYLQLKEMESRKVNLPRKYENVIKALKTKLKKVYGGRFCNLFIFGSVARQEYEEDSDLDLLVVLKEIGNRGKERRRVHDIAYQLTYGSNRPVVVSITVTTEKELLTSLEPVYCRIREEGKAA